MSILRKIDSKEWMDDLEEYYGSDYYDGSEESISYSVEENQQLQDQTPPTKATDSQTPRSRKPTPWKKENLSPLYTIVHFSDDGGRRRPK